MKQSTVDDLESDASTDPLPAFEHDPNCNVCEGIGWHGEVPCYAGVKLPTETEGSA